MTDAMIESLTLEERIRHLELYATAGVDSWLETLINRLDKAEAEIARLNDQIHQFKVEYQDEDSLSALGDELKMAKAEIARLTAALAEANEGRESLWQQAQKLMTDNAAREAAAREEEREQLASLWPCAPTMIGSTPEYEKGFVAGLEAFRAAIHTRTTP